MALKDTISQQYNLQSGHPFPEAPDFVQYNPEIWDLTVPLPDQKMEDSQSAGHDMDVTEGVGTGSAEEAFNLKVCF